MEKTVARKAKGPSETQVAIAIAERLRLLKPRCYWTHVANESGLPSHIAKRVASIHKAMGKTAGFLDLMFLGMPVGFPIYFYEIKLAGKKPTPGQKVFMRHCDNTGIPYDWRASDDWLEHYKIIEARLKAGGAI